MTTPSQQPYGIGGYVLGATMLFEGPVKNFELDLPRFERDLPLYEEMHSVGYRAFQVPVQDLPNEYLLDLKQWADENDSAVASIGFLVAVGDKAACPISDDKATRQRAFDQIEVHLNKAAMLGAVSHFGPYFTGLLNPNPQLWTPTHADRCADFINHATKAAVAVHTDLEFEPLNRFESPVSTLDMAAGLLERANVTNYSYLGPDTCHQGMSEVSTTLSWMKHADSFGRTLHLSDFGRSVLGEQQALTSCGAFDFLRRWEDPTVEYLFIEAFGSDVDPGIASALGLKVLPELTGRQVMAANFGIAFEALTGNPVQS